MGLVGISPTSKKPAVSGGLSKSPWEGTYCGFGASAGGAGIRGAGGVISWTALGVAGVCVPE